MLGHVFRTTPIPRSSFTAISNGGTVFNRLNGMFGLAIWDVRQKRLLLARDPFGIKLIYYRMECRTVYFGSEIRAILAAPGQSAEIDPASINLFLRYRYTPSPHTIYEGSRKLAPGTMLIVERGCAGFINGIDSGPHRFHRRNRPGEAEEELASCTDVR